MHSLLSRFERTRQRSRALFDLIAEEAYYSQPISLSHPIVFYEGHLPGFSFNTLVKRALGRPSIDPALEALFARGIDPHDQGGPNGSHPMRWPDRRTVQQFVAEADRQVSEALARDDLDRPGDPLLDRGEAAYAILEHEAMHQETLLYIWHRLPFDQKRRPAGYAPVLNGSAVPFGWDNEFPESRETVAPFLIQRHNVTNGRFLEFVDAGGYAQPAWWRPDDWDWVQRERIEHPAFWSREGGQWYWRGMFELLKLPLAWPVYVSHAEASAYAKWLGARLPTEAEFQRAAFGAPGDEERRHPWGEAGPAPDRGVFDFSSWDPESAGSHPRGASAWGVEDLVGNGWEWTGTVFGPFEGFRPMASYPEYSADFFDGEHFVMKGASPATSLEFLRPSFRNWFRARYPYVYASFRCVKPTS
jgi:formylglycine-generating enzyme required for sulfatase activity